MTTEKKKKKKVLVMTDYYCSPEVTILPLVYEKEIEEEPEKK